MAYFTVMLNLPQYSTVSHAALYFFRSLEATPPWTDCQNPWVADSASCYVPTKEHLPCETVSKALARQYRGGNVQDGYPLLYGDGVTMVPAVVFQNYSQGCLPGNVSSVVGFYDHGVLGLGDGIQDVLGIELDATLMSAILLLAALAIVGRGFTHAHLEFYTIAWLRYSILIALLGFALSQKGALLGFSRLMELRLESVADITLWQDVIAFALFGVGAGGYGITFISSFNSFHNNLVMDIVVILCNNLVTCLGMAALVLCLLGSFTVRTGLAIDQVITSNIIEDTAFIHVPEAMLSTSNHALLHKGYFLMLACMGFGNLLLTTEIVAEVIEGEFPQAQGNKKLTRTAVGVVCYMCSVVYMTPAGPYLKAIIIDYLYYIVGFVNVILELLVIFHFYGLERVTVDCGLMLDLIPGKFLIIMWTAAIPIVLTTMLVLGLLFRPSAKFRDYEYSALSRVITAAVALMGLTFIPSYAYAVLVANRF
ncbi:unnamed protein product, partial [Ixodes hexagonus]